MTHSTRRGQVQPGLDTRPSAETLTVAVKRLHPNATLPTYQSSEAAGMDLCACVGSPGTPTASLSIEPGQIVLIPCGFAMAIPPGYEGQVRPRSGLATKHGLTVPNAPGTVDSDYRGEMKVALINLGREPYTVTHGQRIAQLVIAPVVRATLVEAAELDRTDRGSGGFGSTGQS